MSFHGEAISPRGDMPKNRVRFSTKGAPCRQSTQSLPTSLRVSSASRIVPRSSTCGRMRITTADPRFSPAPRAAAPRSVSDWASEFVGRPSIVIDQSGEAGQRRDRRMASSCRGEFRRRADWRAPGLGQSGRRRSFRLRKCLSATLSGERSGSRAPARRSIGSPAHGSFAGFVDPSAVFLFVAPAEVVRGCGTLRRRALRHRGRFLESQG